MNDECTCPTDNKLYYCPCKICDTDYSGYGFDCKNCKKTKGDND